MQARGLPHRTTHDRSAPDGNPIKFSRKAIPFVYRKLGANPRGTLQLSEQHGGDLAKRAAIDERQVRLSENSKLSSSLNRTHPSDSNRWEMCEPPSTGGPRGPTVDADV
jgi:hypothetical protein